MNAPTKHGRFTTVGGYRHDQFLIVGGDDDGDYFHLTLDLNAAQQLARELEAWISGNETTAVREMRTEPC